MATAELPVSRPTLGDILGSGAGGHPLRMVSTPPVGAHAVGLAFHLEHSRALQETLEHRGRDHGVQVSTISGTSTYYIHDNNGNLLGEGIGTNHYYYLSDGLGSIVAVISGDGITVGDRYGYDPYGNTTTHTGTTANPWGYAGGYTDPTGLTKFGTRYYDPALGRWTQQDPIGGSIADPNALDRYNYVACNPMNGRDPSGAFCLGFLMGAIFSIAVGLAAFGTIGLLITVAGTTPFTGPLGVGAAIGVGLAGLTLLTAGVAGLVHGDSGSKTRSRNLANVIATGRSNCQYNSEKRASPRTFGSSPTRNNNCCGGRLCHRDLPDNPDSRRRGVHGHISCPTDPTDTRR